MLYSLYLFILLAVKSLHIRTLPLSQSKVLEKCLTQECAVFHIDTPLPLPQEILSSSPSAASIPGLTPR